MNIVIIDDESVICNGLKKTVEQSKEDWTVIECYTDSQEAMEFCDWDDVDLLLVDINMPSMNGLTLVDTLRERGHDTQVVFVSGYSEFEYAKKAIQQHAVDYIIKPVSSKSLKDAISKAEENIDLKKQQMQNESFIQDSIIHITKSFIYDVLFETRRIDDEELKETIKYCRLTDMKYSLFSFITKEPTNIIESIVEDISKDNHNVFLFRGSRYYYTIVLCEKRDMSSKVHETVLDIRHHLKEANFGDVVIMNNINELPANYYNMMVKLKHKFNINTFEESVDIDEVGDEEVDYCVHVINAIEYIRNNYNKKISLAMLSEDLYLHPTYLSNLFKKQTGQTVVDYINNYRIKIAKKLLQDNKNKVFWVSEQVGFVNQRYFSQIFKKNTGYTPVEYKQSFFFSNL
jgi:two-component system response regulator YesN